MNRSKALFTFTAVAFVLSVTTVSFAAEKKSGYFGSSKSEAPKTASAASPASAVRSASTLMGKSGDPKKFAQAMKAIKDVNPRTLTAARQLGSNNAMKTLTSNPTSLKALSAMAKTKAANPSNR